MLDMQSPLAAVFGDCRTSADILREIEHLELL
jgi:hypothetical protein